MFHREDYEESLKQILGADFVDEKFESVIGDI